MESVPLASTQAQHLDNQHPAGISGAQKDFSLRYKDALASFVFFFPLPGGLGGFLPGCASILMFSLLRLKGSHILKTRLLRFARRDSERNSGGWGGFIPQRYKRSNPASFSAVARGRSPQSNLRILKKRDCLGNENTASQRQIWGEKRDCFTKRKNEVRNGPGGMKNETVSPPFSVTLIAREPEKRKERLPRKRKYEFAVTFLEFLCRERSVKYKDMFKKK